MSNQITVTDAQYISIGFCQPKFYLPKVWYQAKKRMERLVELGHVERYNYGRGKGKYRQISDLSIEQLAELL